MRQRGWLSTVLLGIFFVGGCSDGGDRDPGTSTGGTTRTGGVGPTGGIPATGGETPAGGAPPTTTGVGNPDGKCAVPAAGMPESIANPTTVVGAGTPDSCTAQKVVDAVKAGGVVTFNCGAEPLTIAVPEIRIMNNGGKGDGSVTIDGGGKITLAAAGNHRVLYQNTCDESLVWTSTRCDIQTTPHLVLQNLGITGGKGAAGKGTKPELNGGGAIYVGGGTFKAYGIRVTNSIQTNAAGVLAQDLAGGGIYIFQVNSPVYIVNSTFENNAGSNGGAIGGLFISYTIINSLLVGNKATGKGMNPAQSGTTGGGLGGAIYNDGNSMTLTICGTEIRNNTASELGSGAIFFVANDLKGTIAMDQSTFTGNSNNGSVQSRAGIYAEAKDKAGNAGITVKNTTFN